MPLKVIGLNHHSAPIAVRESFAFSPEQLDAALKSWLHRFGDLEAVLLSTCNRTELYLADEEGHLPEDREVFEFLCEEKRLPEQDRAEVREHFFTHEDQDAVSHLFSVTCSLNSMVLGEPQILSQVKNAYLKADEIGSAGPLTHRSFQSALHTAKLVASQTALFQRRVSIPSVAVVDFALKIFERLDDKKTLVFGAGEMAEETLQYLRDHGANTITIANRNRSKAEELAKKWAGSVVDWERRHEELVTTDLLISTTGATEPVLKHEDFRKIEPRRSGKPLFALDLAMPRDIEQEIGKNANVYLYSLDDLQEACEKNRKSRDREIPKAKKIIEIETERFFKDLHSRKSGEIIRQLREGWNSRKEDELKRLFNKLPELDEKTQEEIRYAFDRLVGKLLHPPLQSLRDEPPHQSGTLLEALARLFRLK